MKLPNLAQNVASIEAEGAYHVLARASELERQGRSIIHLEIGEPDFGTEQRICDSGSEAIQNGKTNYTAPAGIIELREAIAADVSKRRGMEIDPKEIVVAPGAKPLLFLPTLAVVNPGDEVIYPDPGFPTYEAMVRVAGGVPMPVPLRESHGFSFDLEELEAAVSDRTSLIVINSPGNPTGGLIPEDDLRRIAAIAEDCNAWVLSDEIYGRMCFETEQAPSIAAIESARNRSIVVDGFSKTYAMTGWRLGYAFMPKPLANKVGLLLVHAVGCTAEFTQCAGIEALSGSQAETDRRMQQYRARRDLLVEGLQSIPGIHCEVPQGAFYAFPNMMRWGKTSQYWSDRLLNEAGVALLPGTAFGKSGEGYLRLCYANSIENLQEAIERIRRFQSEHVNLLPNGKGGYSTS